MNEPIEISADSKKLVRGFGEFKPYEHQIIFNKMVMAMKKCGLSEEQIQRVLQEMRKK